MTASARHRHDCASHHEPHHHPVRLRNCHPFMDCRFHTTATASIKSHRYEPLAPWPKHLQILKLLAICWSAHSTGNTAMRYRTTSSPPQNLFEICVCTQCSAWFYHTGIIFAPWHSAASGQEQDRAPVVSGCDAPPVLDASERILDPVALAV